MNDKVKASEIIEAATIIQNHFDYSGYILELSEGSTEVYRKDFEKGSAQKYYVDYISDNITLHYKKKDEDEFKRKGATSLSEIVNDLKVYVNQGYINRQHYLHDLADNNGVDYEIVKALAEMLGPNEDFDGLVSEIEDYASMGF